MDIYPYLSIVPTRHGQCGGLLLSKGLKLHCNYIENVTVFIQIIIDNYCNNLFFIVLLFLKPRLRCETTSKMC